MKDSLLKDQVVRHADEDGSVSDQARLAILAAFESPDELSEVLGGVESSSPSRTHEQPGHDGEGRQPVGAFLRSIAVRGFRGIGSSVTVHLQPGPGLTVIAGRNGSGKSTLAEAMELALTGINSRWIEKGPVWSRNWRNLHAGEPAEIRIGIAEEGSGTTVVGVDWPTGAQDVVADKKRWVQRSGQKREDVSVLGWAQALEMYRPLLSYDELGQILEGRPSEFHDQLYKLLGLEQLTDALTVLDNEVKRLKQPAAELKTARDALNATLADHEDPRAATALTEVKKSKPNLDVVRPLITEGAADSIPAAWLQAQRLAVPSREEMAARCAAIRIAAEREREEADRSSALDVDRSRLLAAALAFHQDHGDQPCPVCGEGALNAEWAGSAQRLLEQDQSSIQALKTARATSEQARTTLVDLVRSVAKPPLGDTDLATLAAAHDAYDRLVQLPLVGDDALAAHVENVLPDVDLAYAALRQEATELVNARRDAWQPVALDLAEWLRRAERSAETDPQLKIATEASKWLQTNSIKLRNQRIAPLAEKAREIWAALRQESNVELGAIRLEGQKNQRRVVLEAAVDGSETEAFGVMSQGELHALALAVFIPRATSNESPFRFVVFDDPIQAMDPSKIDGFLQVLTKLAADRQIIVFTHDDRLPAAIRRTRAQARIIEVTRGTSSAVTVTDSSWPAIRLLDDAYIIAADEAVPDGIKRAAIPVLCREALEATAWDVFSSSALAAGQSAEAIEKDWAARLNTRQRVAAAVNPADHTAIDRWLDAGATRRPAIAVATKGIHQGVKDFRAAVQVTRTAVQDLRGLAR